MAPKAKKRQLSAASTNTKLIVLLNMIFSHFASAPGSHIFIEITADQTMIAH